MAKKLSPQKAKKILHDKEVHNKPLTEKQRKFFGAVASGAIPKAQNGIEGTMGGLTDKGFNYNGAWGGQFQLGGVLPGAIGNMYARHGAPSKGKYAKKTMASAEEGIELLPDPTDPERKYKLSAIVQSAKEILNPVLRSKNPKVYDEWQANRLEALRKGAVKQYDIDNPLPIYLSPTEVKSELSKYRKDYYEDYIGAIKGLGDYSGLGRESYMGGIEGEKPIESLNYGYRFATAPVNLGVGVKDRPGESFTYSYDPKTGQYKKDVYRNGGKMSYYQAGLDFQPKTISQNGSKMKKNYSKAQDGKKSVPIPSKTRAVAESTGRNVGVDPYKVAMLMQQTADEKRKKDFDEAKELYESKQSVVKSSSTKTDREAVKKKNIAYAKKMGYDYNEKTGEVKIPRSSKKTAFWEDQLVNAPLNALDYVGNLPSRMVQSAYKPNYTSAMAAEGVPSDAGLIESILTDPTTYLSLGGKGLLKAALSKGALSASLLPFYKIGQTDPTAVSRFTRQLNELKDIVTEPEARNAFKIIGEEISKNTNIGNIDPRYSAAISDPNLPIKSLDAYANSLISVDPSQNAFTDEQVKYISNLSSLATDINKMSSSIPEKDVVRFAIDNSKNISPRDILPFFYRNHQLAENEKRELFNELVQSYSNRQVDNPLAEYSAGADLFGLTETYGNIRTSLSDRFSTGIKNLSTLGEQARPDIYINPDYYNPNLSNYDAKEAIHLLVRDDYANIPTSEDRARNYAQVLKKVRGTVSDILQNPANKGDFYVGAHSLSTDSYPLTLRLFSRNKNLVDFTPIHGGDPWSNLSGDRAIYPLSNTMGGLNKLNDTRRAYLMQRRGLLNTKLGSGQSHSGFPNNAIKQLQGQMLESGFFNYHIDKFNQEVGTNMPSAFYSLGDGIKRPNVGIIIKKKGGKVKKDDAGYWNPENWGEPVEIDSPNITMEGVYEPLIGVSDTGDVQYMEPGENYTFDGSSVTEYPVARKGVSVNKADEMPLKKLDNLLNFTNYNDMKKAKKGKNIPKAQPGITALANPAFTSAIQGAVDFQGGYNDYISSVDKKGKGADMSQFSMPGSLGASPLAKDIEFLGMAKQALKERKKAKQSLALSELTKQAATMRPDIQKRKYVRPEDSLLQPDQMGMMPYGGGYDVLGMAEDGMQIGGNLTEIQNMYNPGTLYDNLGYEPLDESSKVKQFNKGGGIPKAQMGIQEAGMELLSLGQGLRNQAILGAINRKTNKWTEQATQNLQQGAMAQALQTQFSPFMKNGGSLDVSDEYKWVSHSWQPQVITKFGEHNVKDLLKPDPMIDTLRTGGNIRSNYMGDDEMVRSMAMGGNLQTHWGGEGEVMSYNPYMPGSGETVMLKGNSHEESDGQGNTGVGMSYSGNMVEAERGEPVVEMQEGGSVDDTSAVVFGNMKIPSYGVSELQDSKAKGKKFKTYASDLAKKEKKQSKIVDKATSIIDNIEGDSPYDMLKMNAAQAMLMGADMSLKDLANKKKTLAGVQNAILDTAEEMGLESDALAKGKIMQAKKGAKISKAQDGIRQPSVQDIMDVLGGRFESRAIVPPASASEYKDVVGKYAYAPFTTTPFVKPAGVDTYPLYKMETKGTPTKQHPIVPITKKIENDEKAGNKIKDFLSQNEGLFSALYNEALPYLRPSNQMQLQPEQLMGEMFALSTNVLEPVPFQSYQPLLETRAPQISAQEQLNQNQADFNAMLRQVGNNPSALSVLAAQKQAADRQAIAQAQAINTQQAIAANNRNIAMLNDATVKNLGALDAQYQRQTQAKAVTKAQAQAALSSIASKIGQNKLENLTSAVMQNMYNFRFGPKGRIINYNPLAKFNIPDVMTLSDEKAAELQKALDKRKSKTKEFRNGSIVKAIKGL